MLQVLEGSGILSGGGGEERRCSTGDLITYEPSEQHAMRAVDEELVLLATITPRPASR
jgi:quercetin dioxygenase-like cupin family protein